MIFLEALFELTLGWIIFVFVWDFQGRFDAICAEMGYYDYDYYLDAAPIKLDFTFYASLGTNQHMCSLKCPCYDPTGELEPAFIEA